MSTPNAVLITGGSAGIGALADLTHDRLIRMVAVNVAGAILVAKRGESDRPARRSHMVPMRRSGSADKVSRAALWLLADDASDVTRALLDVAGAQ